MSEDALVENVETVRERLATVLSGFTNISRENGPYGSSMTRILLTPGQTAALADRLERAEDHAKAERKAGAVDALREVEAARDEAETRLADTNEPMSRTVLHAAAWGALSNAVTRVQAHLEAS
jgi:hypothetical protein